MTDWASLAVVGALALAIAALVLGHVATALALGVATATLIAIARVGSTRSPGPMPFTLRWVLFLPRGPHAPEHLCAVLDPRPGERILEIGPGVGIHSIPMALALAPGGTLEVLDVQERMLATLEQRAARAGVRNLVATCGDAQRLPYADASFDAAYVIGVLGEIPDPGSTLRELRRVLRPAGRLVVGETIFDPDYTRLPVLEASARAAGFTLEHRRGPRASYLARFRPLA